MTLLRVLLPMIAFVVVLNPTLAASAEGNKSFVKYQHLRSEFESEKSSNHSKFIRCMFALGASEDKNREADCASVKNQELRLINSNYFTELSAVLKSYEKDSATSEFSSTRLTDLEREIISLEIDEAVLMLKTLKVSGLGCLKDDAPSGCMEFMDGHDSRSYNRYVGKTLMEIWKQRKKATALRRDLIGA